MAQLASQFVRFVFFLDSTGGEENSSFLEIEEAIDSGGS